MLGIPNKKTWENFKKNDKYLMSWYDKQIRVKFHIELW